MTRAHCVASVLVIIMIVTSPAPGQTTPPTDPTLAALQAQQAQLQALQAQMDAKLKIQQDQQQLLTGVLPASSAVPNSGAFTVTGTNPFPSQRLAYAELTVVAAGVAAKVKEAAPDGPVLVYDQNEINALLNYEAVVKALETQDVQVQQLKSEFDKASEYQHKLAERTKNLLAPPREAGGRHFLTASPLALAIPSLALGGLKTATDLIGMFRTNTSIAYSSFTTDDAALTAAVAQVLVGDGRRVYEPGVMPLQVTDESSAFVGHLSSVQTQLATVQYNAGLEQLRVQQVSDALGSYLKADQACLANRDQIDAETDAGKRATLKAKQADLERSREFARQYALSLLGDDGTSKMDSAIANVLKADWDQFLKVLTGFVTAASAEATSFGALQTALTTATSTGSAPLTSIIRAERLMAVAKGKDASILLVKTSVLGGSVVTRTNLFSGGHLLFTGGAIANFTLFDATGFVKASGVVVGESKMQKASF